MNIVIIPAFFQEKKRPTLGSFFWDQAKALQKKGHNVSILYCDAYSVKAIGDYINYQETKELEIEGIKIFRERCFCPLKHGMEGYREAFARTVISLYDKHLLGQKIDIIHAHCSVWAGYAAMKLSQKISAPYIVTEHATLFQLHRDEISKQNNQIIQEVFRNAAEVICVSKAFAELLSPYRKDIKVVGNVVNCDLFHVAEGKKHTENITFLSVCYMQNEAQLVKKGMDILVEAWSRLMRNYPNARLLIGGGGSAQETLKEWCQTKNVSDSVTLLGALSREQVASQMQNCDCFVLPSRYETFGVVYIEAMACGKPVIAVRNGGPDDFVDENNGVLIEPDDVEQLVKAMETMIKGASDYDAKQIRNLVKNTFSESAIATQLEMVYQTIDY